MSGSCILRWAKSSQSETLVVVMIVVVTDTAVWIDPS